MISQQVVYSRLYWTSPSRGEIEINLSWSGVNEVAWISYAAYSCIQL
jgi:hypothetical protein